MSAKWDRIECSTRIYRQLSDCDTIPSRYPHHQQSVMGARGPSRGPESPSSLGFICTRLTPPIDLVTVGKSPAVSRSRVDFFRQTGPSYLYQTKEAELSRPLSCCSASSPWILHTSHNFLPGMHSRKAGFPSLRESLVSVPEGLWTPFLCVTKIFNWSQDYPY